MTSTLLKQRAEKNHPYREENFKSDIDFSVEHTSVWSSGDDKAECTPRFDETRTDIKQLKIQDWLHSDLHLMEGKTAILNFASYKNPGGGYMRGMVAQEEALCHFTTLYEVISKKPSYYAWNDMHKNRGLYTDRLLYSPNILALDKMNNVIGNVDVITCAAPNMSVGLRYGNFTEEECKAVFKNRILFLFRVASLNGVDNLVLGAWGCGVFKNDPSFVARTFFTTQKLFNKHFKRIIYIISDTNHYDVFLREGASL